MRFTMKKLTLLAMALVTILSLAAPVWAAREEPGKTDPLPGILNSDPADAAAPVTELNIPKVSCTTDFTYAADVVFSGIYRTNKYYFKIEPYWDCRYIYARIEAELSQLIQDVPASMTFMLNDVPITTYKIDYRSGKSQVFYVEIPVEDLKEGYNTFDVTGYVRLYDDDGCIDDFSGANWICMRSSSFIQVGYEIRTPRGISDYPYPFLSSVDRTGSGTAVFVSDKAEENELAAALMLRADLASETDMEDLLTLARLSDSTGKETNRVIVSLYDNLPASYRAAADARLNGASLKDQALIRILQEGSGWTLLITSEDGSCLTEAARMLMDETRVSQERSDTAFVARDASAGIRAQLGVALTSDRMTLNDLMNSGLRFVGPFRQEGHIYLPFAGGYVLADTGMVDLKFRYSENLDFDRSLITVYWGDVPVSSKKLTKELCGGDELTFSMPEDVVGTYAGNITVVFDLELPDLFCTPRMDEMPWAYITGDSTLYLPVGVSGHYTLDQRPYPFEISSRFNDVNVVIPETMTAAELNTLGRIIALYGVDPSAYGSLRVTYADDFTAGSEKSDNLIVLGCYGDNSLIRELNDSLHFRYSDTGSNFRSNDAMILSDSYSRSLSTLQLIPSPYAVGRAVLVVGALDDTTMRDLGDFLTDSRNVWKLEKDTALIDDQQAVRTFSLSEVKPVPSAPFLQKMMETNREATIFTLAAVGVMALFLLVCILVLIRIYFRSKK